MIIGALFGLILGFGFALIICGYILNKSNNLGDSKGGANDFSKTGIRVARSLNKVQSTISVDDVYNPVIIRHYNNGD